MPKPTIQVKHPAHHDTCECEMHGCEPGCDGHPSLKLPAKYEICDLCSGSGQIEKVCSYYDEQDGGYVYDDRDDYCCEDEDENGNAIAVVPTERCPDCPDTAGRVLVLDEAALTPEQTAKFEAYRDAQDEWATEEYSDRRTRWYESGCPDHFHEFA